MRRQHNAANVYKSRCSGWSYFNGGKKSKTPTKMHTWFLAAIDSRSRFHNHELPANWACGKLAPPGPAIE
jgi:hypothetical protein